MTPQIKVIKNPSLGSHVPSPKTEFLRHELMIPTFGGGGFIRGVKRFLPDKSSIISCDKDFWIYQELIRLWRWEPTISS